MCGINGILRLKDDLQPVDRMELLRTRDWMAMRGPDSAGEWLSETGEVALGHRRLAIIDLSEAASQPMTWDNGRYHIVFNGEIYNYRELRNEACQSGLKFHTNSDTEILLALYAREGVDMLWRLRGMYACAIWDNQEKTLFLARDPYGIKPLYYTAEGGYLRFASQVKALEAGGCVSLDVDPAGLTGFLLWGSVPEPFTIRRSVHSLPAGHYLIIKKSRLSDPSPYCNLREVSSSGSNVNPSEALEDSVRAHLVADVPVAVFLSAGLDSSLLTALVCRSVPEPPVTFTLRFDNFVGTPMDEGPLAAEVAKKLGTRHVERLVRREEFLDLWAQVIAAMDQPSIDGFNTYLISKLSHQNGLKVVLSGLGGDEMFGSYPSFRDVPALAKWASIGKRVPGLESVLSYFIGKFVSNRPKLKGFFRYGADLAGAYFLRRGLFLPEELPGLIGCDMAEEGLAAYNPIKDAGKFLSKLAEEDDSRLDHDAWYCIHLMESTQYMRNQLLRDSDWASMAHSLELRVPLVDYWLRERIAAVNFEPARSQGKQSLVKQVTPELPEAVWKRPKSGFRIPVADWLVDSTDPGVNSRSGIGSRRLAYKVLEEFGIEIRRPM